MRTCAQELILSSKVIPTVSGAILTHPGFRGWDLGGV